MLRIAVFLLAVLVSSGAIAQPSSSYLLRPCYGALAAGSTGCGYGPGPVPSGGYTGPGNLVSGATVWYGLRAYSAAKASAHAKSINVRRASDNATSDITVLSNGNLDIATATSFAGVDATCTGTIVTTTATLTGCSSTPNANDPVSGTGITQPAYVVSCGAFVAGAGTCTLNANQTVSVAETISFQVALAVTKIYDQSGSSDASQATSSNQPFLQPYLSGFSCMRFNGTSMVLSATIVSVNQPLSHTAVFSPITQTSVGNSVTANGATGPSIYYDGSFLLSLFAGSVAGTGITLTPGVNYATQALFNSSTSKAQANSTLVTGLNPNTGASSTTFAIGGRSSGVSLGPIYSCETGMWPSDTSSLWTALTANERNYWKF